MKRLVKQIYLVWRRGRGDSRIKVGLIRRNSTEGVTFRYLDEGVNKAIALGFKLYPDFPDPQMLYKNNILEIFAQRLNQTERADIQKYYDYWEIEPALKNDKFYVLAQTQGLLSTDNFEFLAEYYPTKELRFTSEICGLTDRNFESGILAVGDILTWKLDKNNQYDKRAVQLFKNETSVGYIKIIHNEAFNDRRNSNLRVKIKSLEQNGHIRRAFITIDRNM